MMMTKGSHQTGLPLLARILRAYLRSSLRGQTRLTFLLARKLKSLQAVPITIADWSPVYMDLRFPASHDWLKGSPWLSSPREVKEQAVMRRFIKSGDTVFDIGANVGLHTVLLAQLVGPTGRVCVFEPNPELLPALRRTLEQLSNATLYPVALSDQSSESALFVPDDHSMASLADWTSHESLKQWKHEVGVGDTHTVICQQSRMDDLIDAGVVPQPDFIKCDVEGAELMVFRGGSNSLNRTDAPIILFEASEATARGFGFRAADTKDFLAGLALPHYRFFEVQEGGHLVSPEVFNFESNVLAIPQSKIVSARELT